VEEARQYSAVKKLSLAWQLYLFASGAMFVPYFLWSLTTGKLEGPLLPEIAGLVIIALMTGLFAFAIAQPTYRKAKAGTASINQARIAVVWPAGVLLTLGILGYLFGI
jgi:small-conductance mechanosensitive channel